MTDANYSPAPAIIEEVLESQVREDEQFAQAAAVQGGAQWHVVGAVGNRGVMAGGYLDDPWDDGELSWMGGQTVVYPEGYPTDEQAEHIARHAPARELSEVGLKRLILREHRPQEMDDGVYCVECSTSLSLNIDEVPWPCAYIEALQAIYLVTEGETP